MKKLSYVFFVLILISLGSCQKQDEGSRSVNIGISVVNSQGQDLLNSVYTQDNVTLSHIIDGKIVPYKYKDGDGIYKDGLHVLNIFPGNNNDPNITLIQFGTSIPDTIRRQFKRGENYISIAKIWFNGELKYSDVPVEKERRFTIVK